MRKVRPRVRSMEINPAACVAPDICEEGLGGAGTGGRAIAGGHRELTRVHECRCRARGSRSEWRKGREMETEMRLNHPFVLRALRPSDLRKGYLQLLAQLTQVGDVSDSAFARRVEELEQLGQNHAIAVVEDVDRCLVVASGTLLVELKIARSCGKVGHIEDVVVDHSVRSQQLGRRIVGSLVDVARELGCYKVVLDCADENAPFYEKCGFQRNEIQMARYF